MDIKDIKIGAIYKGRGTPRHVLRIGPAYRPEWYYPTKPPEEDGVEFKQGRRLGRVYISTFARWAKEIVGYVRVQN